MLEETDLKFPLPPCRICSAPGAGFHYGVNTCEACKGFFHRSLNHWSRYKCMSKGKCTIQHGQGKMCRLCRYQKCLDMGMSKSAIKTGRYNYKKKTDDILEVKKMTKDLAKECSMEVASLFYSTESFDTDFRDCKVPRLTKKHFFIPQETHLPLEPDTARQVSFNSKEGRQSPGHGTSDMGLPENKFDGSTPVCLNSYSLCQDFHSQNTPESLVSVSPPSGSSEPYNTRSPDMLLSSSSIERERTQNFESSPTQSQLDCLTELSSCAQESSSSSSSSSFSNIQTDHQSIKYNSHSTEDSSSITENAAAAPRPTPSSSHANIPDDMSKRDFVCSNNCPSKMSPCAHWLASLESQNSFEIDNEVADSSTWTIADVEVLYADLDQIVNNLVDAHKKYISQFFEEIPQEELEKQQVAHYEACALRKQMFGNIRRLPDHEYDQLYGETGIDADNRGRNMREFAKAMEDTIWAMVSFAMAIPGFSELPREKKQNLIKYSRQDFCLLNLFKYVNLELSVYRGVEHDWQCSLEMENSDFRKTLDSVFLFLRKFKKLNLTHEQCIILRALVIMAPDRTDLTNSKIISAIYDQLVSALIYLLGKQFDRPMLMFAKIMCLITELRSKGEEVTEMFKNLNLIRYMPINDKPFTQLMYSGIYI